VIETHEQVCVSIFALTAVTSLGDAEQLCAIRKSPPADFYERADVQDCELMRGCPSGRAAIHRRDMRVIPLQVL